MNNETLTTVIKSYMLNEDLELLNICQTSISLVCSIIILFKVFDVASFFKSVKESRQKHKKNQEQKEFQRLKLLFEKMNNTVIDIKLSSSENEDDDEDGDGVLKIARKKKKKTNDSNV